LLHVKLDADADLLSRPCAWRSPSHLSPSFSADYALDPAADVGRELDPILEPEPEVKLELPVELVRELVRESFKLDFPPCGPAIFMVRRRRDKADVGLGDFPVEDDTGSIFVED